MDLLSFVELISLEGRIGNLPIDSDSEGTYANLCDTSGNLYIDARMDVLLPKDCIIADSAHFLKVLRLAGAGCAVEITDTGLSVGNKWGRFSVETLSECFNQIGDPDTVLSGIFDLLGDKKLVLDKNAIGQLLSVLALYKKPAMGFVEFSEKDAVVCVVETGLGGAKNPAFLSLFGKIKPSKQKIESVPCWYSLDLFAVALKLGNGIDGAEIVMRYTDKAHVVDGQSAFVPLVLILTMGDNQICYCVQTMDLL
jgi:hypothetical protein